MTPGMSNQTGMTPTGLPLLGGPGELMENQDSLGISSQWQSWVIENLHRKLTESDRDGSSGCSMVVNPMFNGGK